MNPVYLKLMTGFISKSLCDIYSDLIDFLDFIFTGNSNMSSSFSWDFLFCNTVSFDTWFFKIVSVVGWFSFGFSYDSSDN